MILIWWKIIWTYEVLNFFFSVSYYLYIVHIFLIGELGVVMSIKDFYQDSTVNFEEGGVCFLSTTNLVW